jgi:hypothetical protein
MNSSELADNQIIITNSEDNFQRAAHNLWKLTNGLALLITLDETPDV